jgi:hypothetical protein
LKKETGNHPVVVLLPDEAVNTLPDSARQKKARLGARFFPGHRNDQDELAAKASVAAVLASAAAQAVAAVRPQELVPARSPTEPPLEWPEKI